VYFGKLVFESDEQEFSLRGVVSKKISSSFRNTSVEERFEGEKCLSQSKSCIKVTTGGQGKMKRPQKHT